MASRNALGVAVAVFLVAGCGGSNEARLDPATVRPLIMLAHRIAGESPCAQARDIHALQGRAIALVNRGLIPARLQEPLLSGANALAEQTPACVQPAPRPSPAHEKGKGKGHGRDKHEDEG